MDWHCNLLLSKKQLLKALRAWINYSCNRRYLPSCNQNAIILILYYHGTMSFLPCHAMPFPPSLMCRTSGRNTANKAESSKTWLCWISLLPLKKHRQSNPMMFHNRSVMAQNEQKNRRFANRSEQENWCTDRQCCYDTSVSQGKHLRMNVLGGWR